MLHDFNSHHNYSYTKLRKKGYDEQKQRNNNKTFIFATKTMIMNQHGVATVMDECDEKVMYKFVMALLTK